MILWAKNSKLKSIVGTLGYYRSCSSFPETKLLSIRTEFSRCFYYHYYYDWLCVTQACRIVTCPTIFPNWLKTLLVISNIQRSVRNIALSGQSAFKWCRHYYGTFKLALFFVVIDVRDFASEAAAISWPPCHVEQIFVYFGLFLMPHCFAFHCLQIYIMC